MTDCLGAVTDMIGPNDDVVRAARMGDRRG